MQHPIVLLLLLAGIACVSLALFEIRNGPIPSNYYYNGYTDTYYPLPDWSPPYSEPTSFPYSTYPPYTEPYGEFPHSTHPPYSTHSSRFSRSKYFPYSTQIPYSTYSPYSTDYSSIPLSTETQDRFTTLAPTIEPYPTTECSCTYKNIWLDVFFLIDSSSVMTSHRLDNAVAFALSVLQKMTVGQGKKETRVGWIEFAAKAKVLYNLTYWHSTEEMTDNHTMTFNGSVGADVNSAIRLATSGFKSPAHRPHVKKLIVIIASDGHSTNYSEAVEASLRFKAEGGEIITVEYARGLCKKNATLGKLATSPSYVFSNCDGPLSINKVRKAFCDGVPLPIRAGSCCQQIAPIKSKKLCSTCTPNAVNCFCMKHHELFVKPNKRCYRSVGIPAVQKLASRSCKFHYSTLAKVDSYEKAEFLAGLMQPWESKFWIGLHRYHYDTFAWLDGEKVRNYTFNMWHAGYPTTQGDCVYMSRESGRLAWYNADCDNDENYVCERRPCDTDHFCSEDDEQ